MFDNIIGQTEVIRSLTEELSRSMLPRALLFHGPMYCGKQTVALETARVLTCHRGGLEWECRCPACRQQRLLTHPGMLLMGPRNFHEEIAAAGDVLLRDSAHSSRILFIRAVRKLLKRFDRILWEDEESRLGGAFSLVAEVEEELERLMPGLEPLPREELEELVGNITNLCEKAAPNVQQDNIPIHHVRKTTYWSHLSSFSDRKIVIMENVDRMQESSRNALLAVLEEPPENVYFILTTTRRSMVIRTLLSRLRPYAFSERSASAQREVLRRVFREDSGDFETLREYFLAWKDLNPYSLKGLARTFLEMVEERRERRWMPMDDMAELLSVTSRERAGDQSADGRLPAESGTAGHRTAGRNAGRRSTAGRRSAGRRSASTEEALSVFCEELLLCLRDRLRKSDLSASELSRFQVWAELIQGNLLAMGTLNLHPQLVLENLFLRMRETA